jgi:hypothetical protein
MGGRGEGIGKNGGMKWSVIVLETCEAYVRETWKDNVLLHKVSMYTAGEHTRRGNVQHASPQCAAVVFTHPLHP